MLNGEEECEIGKRSGKRIGEGGMIECIYYASLLIIKE